MPRTTDERPLRWFSCFSTKATEPLAFCWDRAFEACSANRRCTSGYATMADAVNAFCEIRRIDRVGVSACLN